MDAMLLEIPTDLPEKTFSCEICPAVQRLERELEMLRAEFRWEWLLEESTCRCRETHRLIDRGTWLRRI